MSLNNTFAPKLWERAYKALKIDKNLLSDLSKGKVHKGDIITTEADRYKWKLPKTKLDCLIGVGSTVGFDLAGKFKAKNLTLIDISIDVILCHRFYYAPLFRISESPITFLRHICGQENKSSITIKKLFKSIKVQAEVSEVWIDEIKNNKSLSEIEKEFILAIGIKSPCQKSPYPFKSINNILGFKEQFRYMYDSNTSLETCKMLPFVLKLKNLNFIMNKNYYDDVRDLHLNDNVKYSISSIEDLSFLGSVDLKDKQIGIYPSNVFEFIKGRNINSFVSDVIKSEFVGRENIIIFLVTEKETPYTYKTYTF